MNENRNFKRKASVKYTKGAKKTPVVEDIWIQNFPVGYQGNSILMQLFLDKETGKPVITHNQDGVKQYQVSLYGTPTYAYVTITAMTALKALGNAKLIDEQVWVKLDVTSMVPSMADFNNAKAYK